ncbi:MAG: hypothetical protein HMLKMBBP_01221 [Planctomycetes bacterium]|nr:hypothetical protein [Planctomycetota bacterium]
MRRVLAAIVTVFAAATGAPADDGDPATWVTVRADAPTVCRVGQRITLRAEVRIRESPFAQTAVPFTRRSMDVPVQVIAPWLSAPEGARALPRPTDAGGVTFAVNDDVVRGEIVRDEEGVFTIVASRDVVPTAAGRMSLAPPRVRLAVASGFDEDALGARVPLAVREVVVEGAAAAVDVRPLPDTGRPPDFGGAVGRFTVEAHAFPRAAGIGETVRVTAMIEGEGDVSGFAAPRTPAGRGFDVLGVADDRTSPRRTIVWDVAPTTAGELRMAVVLPTFDPTADAWREVRGECEAVTVAGGAAPPSSENGATVEPEAPSSGPGWGLTIAAAAAIGALGYAVGRRRRQMELASAAASPAITVASDAARPEPARTDLVAWLAWSLGATEASVIGPDLADRLRARGVDDATAAEAAAAVERWIAVRYGAPSATAPHPSEVEALVARVDATARRGNVV